MMGLVVIVILVVVGFFLYLGFQINQPEPDVLEPFQNDQLAQNFVNSYVKTQTPCGFTMSKLIQDCATARNLTCEGTGSCILVENVTRHLLNTTLRQWGYSYRFAIPALEVTMVEGDCSEDTEKSVQGVGVISLYHQGEVVVTLDVCRIR